LRSILNQAEVDLAAVRIVEALSSPFNIDGHALSATASVGVSIFPRDGSDMGELRTELLRLSRGLSA
jgi:GGDEF domain-containing protein